MHSIQDFLPVYERVSDYLHNMSALTRGEARRQWRQSIKDAWDNRCAYCGKPPIDDDSLTVDHVRPRSNGGEDKTSNCIPACRECNQDKSSQEWAAWYRLQPFYSIAAEWRIQQWLKGGIQGFGPYSEEDSRIIDDYLNAIMEDWPTG